MAVASPAAAVSGTIGSVFFALVTVSVPHAESGKLCGRVHGDPRAVAGGAPAVAATFATCTVGVGVDEMEVVVCSPLEP